MSRFVLVLVSLLAAVNFVSVHSAGEPIQQRIALAPPHGMSVSWSTVGPIDTLPTVAYGKSATSLKSAAKGRTAHYDASITWFHHVEIHSLEPATKYYWQVTSPVNASSPILSFTTAPKPGDTKPLSIAINGDLGIDNSEASVALLKKIAPDMDLFWHIGDLSYADDWQGTTLTYEEITEGWMSNMTDIWHETPYMILPGNHEISCSESNQSLCTIGQRNLSSYLERYNMPHRQSGSPSSTFYSFDYGMVHFICVDTEVDYPNSPEGPGSFLNSGPFGDQKSWLEKDLQRANANREDVPFILVSGHRPYYSSFTDEQWSASQQFFEPLFVKYNVDVVFWGHVHWYERMWPIGANRSINTHSYDNPADPVYIITSSAGNIEGLRHHAWNKTLSAFIDQDHYGIGVMNVLNQTTLHWTFMESDTAKLLDEITITKDKRKNIYYDTEKENNENLQTQSENVPELTVERA